MIHANPKHDLDTPPGTRRRRAGRWLRRLAWAAAALVLWCFSFVAVLAGVPLGEPEPDWSSADGRPVPDDFLYMGYPVSGAVRLFDGPDGAEIGRLTRSVAVAQHELGGDPWISVRMPGSVAWVRRAELSFDPPAGGGGELVRAYFEAYKARNPGSTRLRVSVSQSTTPDGSVATVLERRPDDDHVERYAYRVEGGVPRAERMWRYFGPGWAMSTLWIVGVAALGASVVTVFAGAGVGMVLRRRRARAVERASAGCP